MDYVTEFISINIVFGFNYIYLFYYIRTFIFNLDFLHEERSLK